MEIASNEHFSPTDHPHRRLNALTGEYVLVSPHRTKRPWQGRVEKLPPENRPQYDPTCYLCPGNTRANGETNPHYTSTYVFTNDFAALLPDVPPSPPVTHPLFETDSVSGTSRVVCFSPRHDLTLAEMEPTDIRRVIDVWAEQLAELGAQYDYVQIFETKGEIMGTSNPHPHGQIWAGNWLPNLPAAEDRQQWAYFARHGRPLLMDYLQGELEQRDRLVVEGEHWVALVPYWAYWPFETMILPRRHVLYFTELTDAERDDLARVYKRLLVRYDNLFETSFPYGSGWHNAPTGPRYPAESVQHWTLHAHFLPPLLRSATVRKFVASYELLAEAQRDLTAEQAAERLRSVSETHYKLA